MGNHTPGAETPKPTLIAVQVPWMVDAATPFFRLHISEDPHEEPSYVEFVGFFGQHAEKGRAYHVIRVIFERGVWVYMRSNDHDAKPPYIARFDDRRLPTAHWPKFTYPKDEVEYFAAQWKERGLCPDPMMYEVQNSPWRTEIEFEPERYKHVYIEGHDYCVQALCTAWHYEEGAILTGPAWT